MKGFLVGGLLLLVTLGVIVWFFIGLVDREESRARDYCHSLNAKALFIRGTHAICVTQDGRVVGHT